MTRRVFGQALNKSILGFQVFFILAIFVSGSSHATAQTVQCELHTRVLLPHKAVYADADPRCNPGRRFVDSIQVEIAVEGFYRINLLTRYTTGAGDAQLNESYFVTVQHAGTARRSYPLDANLSKTAVDSVDANGDAIAYKIVLDDNSLTAATAIRDAGVFFMQAGLNIIEISHYATIADRFPQFENFYPASSFSDPCYEALPAPVISAKLGGKYNAESVEIDSMSVEQIDCQPFDMQFTKSASQDTVFTTSDTLQYALAISNNGIGDAFNVTVRDTLPAFVTPFSFNPLPDKIDNNILEWQIRFFPKDASELFAFSVAVDVTPADTPVVLSNRGGVFAKNDTLDSNNSQQVEVLAIPKPVPPRNYDLALSKSANRDSVWTQNDTLAYRLVLRQLGPHTAFGITVTDSLPDFVTAYDISPLPGRTGAGFIEWQLDSLAAADSVVFLYSANVNAVPADALAALINRSRVRAPNDTAGGNDGATSIVVAVPKPKPPPRYDLSISKLASRDSVFATEDSLRYNLLLRNHGPDVAYQVMVADTLPPFVDATDFNLLPDRNENGILNWTLDSLAVNRPVLLSYVGRLNAPSLQNATTVFNRAAISASFDTLSSNNMAQDSVVAVPRPVPEPPRNYDISLTKSANIDSVNTGGSMVDYQLVMINHGPHTAYQITLIDTLPDFVTPTWFSHPPVNIVGHVVEWRFDSLEVNRATQVSLAVDVNVTPRDTTIALLNRGFLRAPNDTIAANNSAQASVLAAPEPQKYDVILTKSASRDSVFTTSDSLEFTLTIRNAGPGRAAQITVTDTLPPFTSALNFSIEPSSISGRIIEWQLAGLAANSSLTIRYDAKVEVSPADSSLFLTNVAAVNAPHDSVAGNNRAAASVFAVPRPPIIYVLELRKKANLDSVRSGEVFSYTISITNVGTGPITAFTVRDLLPERISADKVRRYFPRPPDAGSNNVLRWEFGSLAVGATQVISFDVAGLTLPQPGTLDLVNVAEVTVPATIPFAGSSDSARVTVVAEPELECYLDHNVWQPGSDPLLGINFGLRSGSEVRIKIHDLAGTLIRDLLDQPFGAGQYRIEWDGRAESGLLAGSGVYVVTFESQYFIDWKKVMIVR